MWFSGEGGTNPIEAEFGFYLDGLVPQEGEVFERIFILFNGFDEERVSAARGEWKRLQDAGHDLSYWTEGAGGWQKTA